MKSFIKIIALLVFPMLSQAQISPLFVEATKKQADSLRLIWKQNNNDTLKMAAARDLALYYLENNADSALYFIKLDMPMAKKLRLKLWEADALDLYSVMVTNEGNFVAAYKAITEAQKIAVDTLSGQGNWNISKFTDNRDQATARRAMLATIRMDFGGLYFVTKNYDKAFSWYKLAIKTAVPINDYTVLCIAYLRLGDIDISTGKPDAAFLQLQKALNYSVRSGFKKYKGDILSDIGNVYSAKQNFAEALSYLSKAVISEIEQNNSSGLAKSYINLALLFNKKGERDSADYYAGKGLALYKKTKRTTGLDIVYPALADIYQSENKPDSALHYLRLADAIRDSLNGADKVKTFQNLGFEQQLQLQELENEKAETKSAVRFYTLLAGLLVFSVFAILLYRNNRQRKKANIVLEDTLFNLKATQTQLIQSEKMASLGELTAGIAHEIQNPLNFVNNFSEVSKELLGELKEELDKGDIEEAKILSDDVIKNLEKINHHGKRADAIVKGMLEHSRVSSGKKEPTDINALADEYLRLSYHGLRAKDKNFNAEMVTNFDVNLPKISVIPQDIGRVFLNLFNNAFYAVNQKAKTTGTEYLPAVSVTTSHENRRLTIVVRDNGVGIPDTIKDKIMQPFFTTKPTGEGTGLGLSLSYDIVVKGHGGTITVDTKENEFTEFTLTLPIS